MPVVVDGKDGAYISGQILESRKLDSDELMEVIDELQMFAPDLTALEIIQRHLNDPHPVCPTGLLISEYHVTWLYAAYTRAREFKILPYKGGQFDQPLYILEAFDICSATRAIADYRNYENQQRADELNKQHQKNRGNRGQSPGGIEINPNMKIIPKGL